jgi:hypothetical protein
MRKPIQSLVLASAFAGIVATTSPLYAEATSPSPGPSKGAEMMGGGDMMGGNNPMGGSDMTGMMNMMTQMNQMMVMMNMMAQMNQMTETCNRMMQSSMDKDHGSAPAVPEKKG